MIYEYSSMEEFIEAVSRNPLLRKSVSPGHARSELGISRQALFQLVKRGVLDEIRIASGSGNPILLILEESYERFRDSPMRTRAPNFRQRMVHEWDLCSGSWPDDE